GLCGGVARPATAGALPTQSSTARQAARCASTSAAVVSCSQLVQVNVGTAARLTVVVSVSPQSRHGRPGKPRAAGTTDRAGGSVLTGGRGTGTVDMLQPPTQVGARPPGVTS